MRFGFRHADSRFAFFWEGTDQPAARWHSEGAGPAQYLADTSDGAWAEFLRHEEITEGQDLAGIARSLWVVQLPDDIDSAERVDIPAATGGRDSYVDCQQYAARRRAAGVTKLRAPSAALRSGSARGQLTDGGLREAPDKDGEIYVLYGTHPTLRAWRVVERGAPSARLLNLVRHFDGE
jgi:hypothetical protein